ncbi:MAG: hypothetical protein JWR34_7399 [Mycobacterium sp.]|nr:hypothetical protein [Mycobacterium sp.]
MVRQLPAPAQRRRVTVTDEEILAKWRARRGHVTLAAAKELGSWGGATRT